MAYRQKAENMLEYAPSYFNGKYVVKAINTLEMVGNIGLC